MFAYGFSSGKKRSDSFDITMCSGAMARFIQGLTFNNTLHERYMRYGALSGKD